MAITSPIWVISLANNRNQSLVVWTNGFKTVVLYKGLFLMYRICSIWGIHRWCYIWLVHYRGYNRYTTNLYPYRASSSIVLLLLLINRWLVDLVELLFSLVYSILPLLNLINHLPLNYFILWNDNIVPQGVPIYLRWKFV